MASYLKMLGGQWIKVSIVLTVLTFFLVVFQNFWMHGHLYHCTIQTSFGAKEALSAPNSMSREPVNCNCSIQEMESLEYDSDLPWGADPDDGSDNATDSNLNHIFFLSESKLFPLNATQVDVPLLTLMTTFKEHPDRIPMHSAVVLNWASLKPQIQPVLFTTQAKGTLIDMAYSHGWHVLPAPRVNDFGTPMVKEMYTTAYSKFTSHFYAYANGDLLFNSGLAESLRKIIRFYQTLPEDDQRNFRFPFIVGHRRNYEIPKDFDPMQLQGEEAFHEALKYASQGAGNAIDYFITVKDGYPWSNFLPLVIGRSAYDQYLLMVAMYQHLLTIDATRINEVIHLQGSNATLTHKKDRNLDIFHNAYLLAGLLKLNSLWSIARIPNTEMIMFHPPGSKEIQIKERILRQKMKQSVYLIKYLKNPPNHDNEPFLTPASFNQIKQSLY